MEPLPNYLKIANSPLYERRLAIIILKKYSYGRRSFSENARFSKIKEEHRNRHYEPEKQIEKENETNEESEKTKSPRIGYTYISSH
jgi:hypothetical protein